MSRLLLISTIIVTAWSCQSQDNKKSQELLEKENELLKRELALKEREESLSKTESQTEERATRTEQKVRKRSTHHTVPNRSPASIVSDIHNIMNSGDYTSCKIDQRGNFEIDMGSFSAGRVAGNLKNITLEREHREEEPGCADICPERILIHFKCQAGQCLYDPAMGEDEFYRASSVIQFYNLPMGNNFYDLLSELKATLKD